MEVQNYGKNYPKRARDTHIKIEKKSNFLCVRFRDFNFVLWYSE